MAKEWFTISELRAASVPGFSDLFFKMLVSAYPRLSSSRARARLYPGTEVFQALEFHVGLFTRPERAALEDAYAGAEQGVR